MNCQICGKPFNNISGFTVYAEHFYCEEHNGKEVQNPLDTLVGRRNKLLKKITEYLQNSTDPIRALSSKNYRNLNTRIKKINREIETY